MALERHFNSKRVPVKLKMLDMDAPTLVDRIGKVMLDHLARCEKCFQVFAAQKESLERSGCIEGMRIVTQSQVKWEERRSDLALHHITSDVIDDYVFNRLTAGEEEALKWHAQTCIKCAGEIKSRRILVGCVKAALCERQECEDGGAQQSTAVNVRFPGRALSMCVGGK